MPSKLYELRVYKGTQQVRTANRITCALNLDDPDAVNDLLSRHLYAAAERDGANRREAHLYHLDIYEMRGEHVDNRAAFQFALPVVA